MNGSFETPILTSLRLLKASNLARQGKMRAAQAVLAAEGTVPENPVEHHALAALVTSEGNYRRALRLWQQLLQRDPRHAEARRMIAAIELWLSRPPWVRFVPAGAAVMFLLLVAAVVALAGGSPPPPVKAVPPPPAAVSSPSSSPAPRPITAPTLRKRRPGQ
jgi:hypothetical protein